MRLMPANWMLSLQESSGTICKLPHLGNMFVCENPRAPVNASISITAMCKGAWVVSPAVFVGQPGPSIKFKSSLATKRQIWASLEFRAEFPFVWRTLLENILHVCAVSRWSVLSTAESWASARELAEKKSRPTEVIALVSSREAANNPDGSKIHCFTLEQFIEFIAITDPAKGSIGLLGM